jgi:hypothetical protein
VSRTSVAAVLLVLLLPMVVVANASTWALRTVLDDRVFAATVGRILDTPTLEAEMSERATSLILDVADDSNLRLQALATQVLGLPTANRTAVETALESRIATALGAPAVVAARDDAVSAVHRFVTGAAKAEPPLAVRGSQVVLDLGDIVEEVAAELDPRLPALGLASLPAAKTTVVLGEASQLRMVSQGITLLAAARIVIPLAVVAVILAIVGLAHRRIRALGIVGVAIMVAGLVSLAVAWVGGGVVSRAPEDLTVRTIIGEVYDAFIGLLLAQSLLLVAAGAAIAVVALFAARRRERSQRRREVERMFGPRSSE